MARKMSSDQLPGELTKSDRWRKRVTRMAIANRSFFKVNVVKDPALRSALYKFVKEISSLADFERRVDVSWTPRDERALGIGRVILAALESREFRYATAEDVKLALEPDDEMRAKGARAPLFDWLFERLKVAHLINRIKEVAGTPPDTRPAFTDISEIEALVDEGIQAGRYWVGLRSDGKFVFIDQQRAPQFSRLLGRMQKVLMDPQFQPQSAAWNKMMSAIHRASPEGIILVPPAALTETMPPEEAGKR